ncbi:hypothetical protein EG863_15340, partial [Enterococcus faecalis]
QELKCLPLAGAPRRGRDPSAVDRGIRGARGPGFDGTAGPSDGGPAAFRLAVLAAATILVRGIQRRRRRSGLWRRAPAPRSFIPTPHEYS